MRFPLMNLLKIIWIAMGLKCGTASFMGRTRMNIFAAAPFNEDDFGCYAPVICKALENVFRRCAPKLSGENGGSDMAYKAVDETGAPIHELLERYIDKGMPVIFWACIDMREPLSGRNGSYWIQGKSLPGFPMNIVCFLLVMTMTVITLMTLMKTMGLCITLNNWSRNGTGPSMGWLLVCAEIEVL